jgi:hypothetical protein
VWPRLNGETYANVRFLENQSLSTQGMPAVYIHYRFTRVAPQRQDEMEGGALVLVGPPVLGQQIVVLGNAEAPPPVYQQNTLTYLAMGQNIRYNTALASQQAQANIGRVNAILNWGRQSVIQQGEQLKQNQDWLLRQWQPMIDLMGGDTAFVGPSGFERKLPYAAIPDGFGVFHCSLDQVVIARDTPSHTGCEQMRPKR